MNAERLLKLADHLESGQRGHPAFDFTVLSQGERLANGCGSAGCALGELPFLFPREWFFIRSTDFFGGIYDPVMDGLNTRESGMEFFGIDRDEYENLFLMGDRAPWNDADLEDDATPQQVAQGLRNFVAWNNRSVAALSRAEEPEMVGA